MDKAVGKSIKTADPGFKCLAKADGSHREGDGMEGWKERLPGRCWESGGLSSRSETALNHAAGRKILFRRAGAFAFYLTELNCTQGEEAFYLASRFFCGPKVVCFQTSSLLLENGKDSIL